MSQASLDPLNPADTSGIELSGKMLDAEEALFTQHSGGARPDYVQPGMQWLDTSGPVWIVNVFDGEQDVAIDAIDPAAHRKRAAVAGVTIASAATADVLGAAADFVTITGAETIASLGLLPLQVKFVRFAGAATLVRGPALDLPTAADIVTAAGDRCTVISDAAGNATVQGYQRNSGKALVETPPDIESGTRVPFQQSAAPLFFTKDSTANLNDRAMRVVTGTAGLGGNLDFSNVFARTATDLFTLAAVNLPSYNLPDTISIQLSGSPSDLARDLDDNQGTVENGSGSNRTFLTSIGFSETNLGINRSGGVHSGGGGQAFSIPFDIRVKRADFIIGVRD